MAEVGYCEQDELLKYEYTLASCYEAEYLLSLKLQDQGMIYDSSGEYYDVFEIHYPNCTATAGQQAPLNAAGGGQQPLCNGAEASGRSCEVEDSDCRPVSESMETGENSAQPHLDQNTTNGWLFSESGHQPFNPWQAGQVAEAKPAAAVQNGQQIDPNLYEEGPSRKRICLHQEL